MRTTGASLAIMALLTCVVAGPAGAADGDARRISNEPAATLLIPYFEAQVPKKIGGKPSGVTTLVTVGNASASAGLMHVTIWTDLGIPVLNFDLYMTGYDQVTFDMQDVLNGKIPFTADDGLDQADTGNPADGISNQGPISQDINFPGTTGPCRPAVNGSPAVDTPLDATVIAHLRAALTGNASPLLNGCAGLHYNDKKPIARGYITIDDINQCTTADPNQLEYYNVIGVRNIWWGEYMTLDRSKKIGRGDNAVHIRAETNDAETLGPGAYTFYTRFEGVASTAVRQPLATTFFAPFDNVPKDPTYPQGTSFIVWRDPKVSSVAPFPCGTTPPWFPLQQDDLVAFDEQENPEDLSFFPPTPPAPPVPIVPFPAATQLVKLDTVAFPTTFTRGQLYLNLNTTVAAASNVPFEAPGIMQNWVIAVRDNKNKYSVGTRATNLDSATNTNSVVLIP
jgi:hypothetical protein